MKKVVQIVWSELLPLSPVFTTREVARRAGVALSNASRDLAELEENGMLVRVRRGLWAVLGHPDFSPYAVVPHLFAEQPGGYVSLLSALNLHAQRPTLQTRVGTYEFFQIAPKLFGGHRPYRRSGNFDIATPEKTLFDTLYFSARKGRRFAALPEIEVPGGFSRSEVEHWIERIDHQPLRTAVLERWAGLARRVGAGT